MVATREQPAGAPARSGLLGGAQQPLGWSVGFLRAPHDVVADALASWRRSLGRRFDTTTVTSPVLKATRLLPPLRAVWNTELLIEHGDGWTCYLNNSLGGGDPAPVVGHLVRVLDVHGVLATHQPLLRVGHAATQFEYLGPEGEAPLRYIRTLSAHAQDGRWSWHTSGDSLPFEDQTRYAARRIRDRLDRDLLIAYLAHLGIQPDNPLRFGSGTLVQQPVNPSRSMSLHEARDYWSLPG